MSCSIFKVQIYPEYKGGIYITKVGTHLADYSVSQYAAHSKPHRVITENDILRYNGKYRQLYKAYVRFQSNLYGILVVKMALGRVIILQEDMLRFSPVILPLLHAPLSTMHHRSYAILATTTSLNKTSDLCFLFIYQR